MKFETQNTNYNYLSIVKVTLAKITNTDSPQQLFSAARGCDMSQKDLGRRALD